MRGWGKGSIAAAKVLAPSSSRAGVTLCTAPKVLMTLLPVKPSWTGAAIRSKRPAGTFGFWMWRPKALAMRLMASAMGTLLRPMEMTRRGHGAASGSFALTARQQPGRGQIDLQACREQPHGARDPHAFQRVG